MLKQKFPMNYFKHPYAFELKWQVLNFNKYCKLMIIIVQLKFCNWILKDWQILNRLTVHFE